MEKLKILIIDKDKDFIEKIKTVLGNEFLEDYTLEQITESADENGNLGEYVYDIIFKSVYSENIIEHSLKLSQNVPFIFFAADKEKLDEIKLMKRSCLLKSTLKREELLNSLIAVLATRKTQFDKNFLREVIYKTVMDDMDDGIMIVDKGLNPIVVNNSAKKYLGATASLNPKITFDSKTGYFISEEDGETIIEEEKHPLALALQGIPTDGKVVLCKHNQTNTGYWLTVNCRPLREGSRKVFGAILILKDFTKKKLKDIELNEKMVQLELEGDKLQSILESMKDGVVMVDQEGKTILFNSAAKTLLGPHVNKMMLAKDPWNEFIIYEEDEATPFNPDYLPAKQVLAGNIVEEINFYINHVASPQGYYLSLAGRPLLGHNSNIINGAVIVVNDRTKERMQIMNERIMVEKIKSGYDKLKILDEEKNALMAIVQHDLVNPIGAIQGITELYLEEKFNFEDGESFISAIFSASKELSKMVKDMLSESRIRSQVESKSYSKVDFSNILSRSRPVLLALALGKKISLKIDVPENLPSVNGDEVSLARVIENLGTNSIKFTPENGEIKISLSSSEDKKVLILSISDTGVGMSQEQIDKIFAGGTTMGTAGEKGTGLGMAFVKRMMDSHGGSIKIESELGKGTTYLLHFPVIDNNSKEAA